VNLKNAMYNEAFLHSPKLLFRLEGEKSSSPVPVVNPGFQGNATGEDKSLMPPPPPPPPCKHNTATLLTWRFEFVVNH